METMKKRKYNKPEMAEIVVKMQMLCSSPSSLSVKGYSDDEENGEWKNPNGAD